MLPITRTGDVGDRRYHPIIVLGTTAARVIGTQRRPGDDCSGGLSEGCHVAQSCPEGEFGVWATSPERDTPKPGIAEVH